MYTFRIVVKESREIFAFLASIKAFQRILAYPARLHVRVHIAAIKPVVFSVRLEPASLPAGLPADKTGSRACIYTHGACRHEDVWADAHMYVCRRYVHIVTHASTHTHDVDIYRRMPARNGAGDYKIFNMLYGRVAVAINGNYVCPPGQRHEITAWELFIDREGAERYNEATISRVSSINVSKRHTEAGRKLISRRDVPPRVTTRTTTVMNREISRVRRSTATAYLRSSLRGSALHLTDYTTYSYMRQCACDR